MDDLEIILPFKDKLRGIRNLENMTMVELAKYSGLSQSYISQLENGKTASDENIEKLARGLSKGSFSASQKRDTAKDYEKTLKSSRDSDELINKQQALNEATKKFKFEHSIEKDSFLDELEEKLNSKSKRSLRENVSDFFGLKDSDDDYDEELIRLKEKYKMLDDQRKVKAESYIDFLLYEQSK